MTRPWWSGREDCDCDDCDGTWCAYCLTHHGRRRCPVEEECRREEGAGPLPIPKLRAYLAAPGRADRAARRQVLELARRALGAL